jgi:hypothetical protein
VIEGSCLCGAVKWRFDGMPESVTACNCTACRRYGVLWIYGREGEDVHVLGNTQSYVRGKALSFNFCATCGCVVSWRGTQVGEKGRRRMAVNLRLTEPGPVAHLPIDHFDGLDTFEDRPRDGRCVVDMWF